MKKLISVLFLGSFLVSAASCGLGGSDSDDYSLKPWMRDNQKVSDELFTYVWAPERFADKKNEKRKCTQI